MINLMPPELKKDIRYGKANVSLAQYALFIVVIGISIGVVFLFGLSVVGGDKSDLEESIAQKNSTLSGLSEVENRAKELETKIETVNSLLDREVKFSILLQEIGSVLPEGAYLTDLSVTGESEEPLVLRATINTQELAAVLRQNLEDSELFAGADIQTISRQTDEGGGSSGFTTDIVVQFSDEYFGVAQ